MTKTLKLCLVFAMLASGTKKAALNKPLGQESVHSGIYAPSPLGLDPKLSPYYLSLDVAHRPIYSTPSPQTSKIANWQSATDLQAETKSVHCSPPGWFDDAQQRVAPSTSINLQTIRHVKSGSKVSSKELVCATMQQLYIIQLAYYMCF